MRQFTEEKQSVKYLIYLREGVSGWQTRTLRKIYLKDAHSCINPLITRNSAPLRAIPRNGIPIVNPLVVAHSLVYPVIYWVHFYFLVKFGKWIVVISLVISHLKRFITDSQWYHFNLSVINNVEYIVVFLTWKAINSDMFLPCQYTCSPLKTPFLWNI